MDILLSVNQTNWSQMPHLQITGSKSETNRLLLLQALFPQLSLNNESDSDDAMAMRAALQGDKSVVDIHHAGTAMRFLTAYFAIQPNRVITLTGSTRMQERPIKILVEAMRLLGAEIDYLGREGFPPIQIKGKKLIKNKVTLEAGVSSQYISALLLIAAKLENGLELSLTGAITSAPYINMTLKLLNEVGIKTAFDGNTITVRPAIMSPDPITLTVESDWSSASYFYSVVALSAVGTRISISSFKKDSLQGDSKVAEIYRTFGVNTIYDQDTLHLEKLDTSSSPNVKFDLNDTPDIAQTIAVSCFGLGIGCELTGLHTLKIKETDRLEALKTELAKLGASVTVTESSLILEPAANIEKNIAIDTYNDHRMAMAFAPLGLRTPLVIKDSNVVSKSYPGFWADLKQLGFEVARI